MLKGKKCPRAGLRVKAEVNPVSAMLYSPGHGPTPGATGTVTKLGRKTCMPGPGGGLVYVDWDDGRTFGVSRHDLAKSKGKAVVMQASPAVYGLGAVGGLGYWTIARGANVTKSSNGSIRIRDSRTGYSDDVVVYTPSRGDFADQVRVAYKDLASIPAHVRDDVRILAREMVAAYWSTKPLGAVGHDPLHNETVLKNYGKCLRKCKRKPHVGPCIDACLAEQPVPSGEALGTIPGRYEPHGLGVKPYWRPKGERSKRGYDKFSNVSDEDPPLPPVQEAKFSQGAVYIVGTTYPPLQNPHDLARRETLDFDHEYGDLKQETDRARIWLKGGAAGVVTIEQPNSGGIWVASYRYQLKV